MPRSAALNQTMRRRSIAAIQQAALAEFAQRGFHVATMAQVAERAGVTKGLIYNYFPTKDDLLVALVGDRLRTIAAAPEPADAGDPAEALRRRVDQGVARAVEERDFYRLYFGLLLQPGMAPVIAHAEAALESELAAETARLAAHFARLSDQPGTDLLLFQLALNGLALALLVRPELRERPEAFPLDALRDRLVELFVRAGAQSTTGSVQPPDAPEAEAERHA